jgi:predicted MPP superfamily phosphohydrolase
VFALEKTFNAKAPSPKSAKMSQRNLDAFAFFPQMPCIAREGVLNYANAVFARILLVIALMFVLDVAWWVAALRLTKPKLGRILVSVFMACQMTGLFAFIAARWWQVDWMRQIPKAAWAAVVIWHVFGLAVLLPIGIVRVCAWVVRGLGRVAEIETERPAPAPLSEDAVTRREFLGGAAALAPPLFTIGLTGAALAQLDHFRVRRFTLSMPALPRVLDGITIAHVSDMHVGTLTRGRVLREMVQTINAMRADLVLLTGDLINDALADLSEAISLVKAMEARHGLWMIEGNHDLIEDGAEFERRVKAAGVPLLLNESAVASVRGYPVQLFGLRWTLRGDSQRRDQVTAAWLRELMKQRQPDAFPILLAHHPHAFDAAVEADLPLTLAGHTHGGQLMFNSQYGVGPVMFRYWSGLYTRGRGQLIVSNGIGNWFPLRINAPAEIIHLTLRCG